MTDPAAVPAPTPDADDPHAEARAAKHAAKALVRAARDARSAARGLALQLLYAYEANKFQDDGFLLPTLDPDEVRTPEMETHAQVLFAGFQANRIAVDGAIDKRLDNWTIHRLAMVDRNILRLGAVEILYQEDTPVKVAINEAIELAKRYGSDEKTAKLVNGVLDRLAREHRGQDMKPR